jgi:hypothetical protein
MIAKLRTFVSRHLIADDPWPQYSRLDLADGLSEAAAGTPKEPAEMEARLAGDRQTFATGITAESVQDPAYLLALAREQAAKLDAVAQLVDHAAQSGKNTVNLTEVQAAISEQSAA